MDKKETIRIDYLGWFWAVNRRREIDYYVKNYIVGPPEKEYTRRLLMPYNFGQVISYNFLNTHLELLGRLTRHYQQERVLCEYDTFGVTNPLHAALEQPHTLYEMLWASFRSYMFPIKMLAELFGVDELEIRDRYNQLDKEFELGNPWDETLYYTLEKPSSILMGSHTEFTIYDAYTVPLNLLKNGISRLYEGNTEVWDSKKYTMIDMTRNRIFIKRRNENA